MRFLLNSSQHPQQQPSLLKGISVPTTQPHSLMKIHPNETPLRIFRSLAMSTLFVRSAAFTASAANKTWDGGGADNLWKTAANWDANTAPVAGDVLNFTATTRLGSTNDFAAGTGFGGINFLS